MPENPLTPLPTDVAMGEIWRSQQRIESMLKETQVETKARLTAGESRIDQVEDRLTKAEATSVHHGDKINSINTGLGWLVTTVIGAIILAVIRLITI